MTAVASGLSAYRSERGSSSGVRDYSRDGALATLEASLRRLDTDRIDIALIHDPDDYAAEALDGAYAALDQLRSEGTIQAIGVGMNQAPLLEWFVERADLDCVLVAGRYSLLDTAAADGLFPACQRRGVAVLAAGVFNSGILADPRPGTTYDYAPAPVGLLDRAQRIRTVCANVTVCRSVPPPSGSFSATQPSQLRWSARATRRRSPRT